MAQVARDHLRATQDARHRDGAHAGMGGHVAQCGAAGPRPVFWPWQFRHIFIPAEERLPPNSALQTDILDRVDSAIM
jgi:hypothetical protein